MPKVFYCTLRKEIQGHYLEVLRKNSTKRDNYYWVTIVTTNFGVFAKKNGKILKFVGTYLVQLYPSKGLFQDHEFKKNEKSFKLPN